MFKRKPRPWKAFELSMLVDDQEWRPVRSLSRSGPDDAHFIPFIDRDGELSIQFGDGKHGRRPPSGESNIRLVYRIGSGYSGVRLQQGNVLIDQDFNEPSAPPAKLCGVHRGVVINNKDPLAKKRLQVEVPSVLGNAAVWVLPCLPAGNITLPDVGQGVWVIFEEGNPDMPVWVGVIPS